MQLSSNQISRNIAHRYAVPLNVHFKSSQETGCLFAVVNAARQRFIDATLNPESILSLVSPSLGRITYYLPQSSLCALARTCRFFSEFLRIQFNRYKMTIDNEKENARFFEVLDSLQENDFFAIRSLRLYPEYKINKMQLFALITHLPILEQSALPDVTEIKEKHLKVFHMNGVKRLDVMTNDEKKQREIALKLEKMTINAEPKIYVFGRKTDFRTWRPLQKLDDATTKFVSACCILSLFSECVMLSYLVGTNSKKEKSLLKTLMITNLVLCCIFPCIAAGISALVQYQYKKVHHADYEVIPDV